MDHAAILLTTLPFHETFGDQFIGETRGVRCTIHHALLHVLHVHPPLRTSQDTEYIVLLGTDAEGLEPRDLHAPEPVRREHDVEHRLLLLVLESAPELLVDPWHVWQIYTAAEVSPICWVFSRLPEIMIRHTNSLLILSVLLIACNGDEGTRTVNTPERKVIETTDRDNWQRPHELFFMMEGFLKGKTVADLFAGDGYFTFKLIEQGANVIAIDNDPANIAKLEARKKDLGLSDDRLKIRAVPVGDPGLAQGEADVALIVHSYLKIQDRRSYVQRLRDGLKFPRPLFIVDWQYRETPVGPPLAQRMPVERIMEELGSYGYTDVGQHSAKMPYQVIFFASDPMEMDPIEYQRMMDEVKVRPQE